MLRNLNRVLRNGRPPMMHFNRRMFSAPAYENILVEQKEENICFIQLNRPKALNALCDALFQELSVAVKEADRC